jgi:hypothetical protein
MHQGHVPRRVVNQEDAKAAYVTVVELLAALRAADISSVRELISGQLADDTLASHAPIELVCNRLGIGSADLSRVAVAPRAYPRRDGSAIVPVTAAERSGLPASGVLVTREERGWRIAGLARLDTSSDVFRVDD